MTREIYVVVLDRTFGIIPEEFIGKDLLRYLLDTSLRKRQGFLEEYKEDYS